jgi:hypothetical protein
MNARVVAAGVSTGRFNMTAASDGGSYNILCESDNVVQI